MNVLGKSCSTEILGLGAFRAVIGVHALTLLLRNVLRKYMGDHSLCCEAMMCKRQSGSEDATIGSFRVNAFQIPSFVVDRS